ncbi:MAG: hypothetical protein AABZ14_00525 [Candidatus Margulisiibacteriota bacterium]
MNTLFDELRFEVSFKKEVEKRVAKAEEYGNELNREGLDRFAIDLMKETETAYLKQWGKRVTMLPLYCLSGQVDGLLKNIENCSSAITQSKGFKSGKGRHSLGAEKEGSRRKLEELLDQFIENYKKFYIMLKYVLMDYNP